MGARAWVAMIGLLLVVPVGCGEDSNAENPWQVGESDAEVIEDAGDVQAPQPDAPSRWKPLKMS